MTAALTATVDREAGAKRTRRAPGTPVAPPTAPWRNRIVGTGEEAPDQLLANPKNWRTHPGPQRDALRGSLSTVGWVQQVMVNRRTGHVVDGHARIEEALTRHEPTVPVLYVDLSPEEEALVLATLDPMSAMATQDDARLQELLAGITVDDAGLLALLGDLSPGPKAGLTDPDDVPPLGDDSHIKAGDLFALGDHRLMCGDSLSADHVTRLLGEGTPVLLITDPPYGVSLDPTWRDGVYNALGPAEKPYMRISGTPDADDATAAPTARRGRTKGHRNTTLSGDTRVDWSEAFALVPSLEVGYVTGTRS